MAFVRKMNDFHMGKRIGKGSFGQIRSATNLQTGERVAVKLESVKSEFTLLPYEARLYRLFQGGQGFPHFHWFGVKGKHRALAIDLLGPSLETLFNSCNRKFSIPTVAMIAEQAISRLEYIHNRNFIHRDIKPDNFLIGLHKKSDIVHLIDFGLAKKFRHNGVHIPYREGKSLTGTSRYVSLNAHFGIQQSRRDDLEGLGYVLVYFAKGSLPWQGLKLPEDMDRDDLIEKVKKETTVEMLCEGLPSEFAEYIKYCKGLGFEHKPDYSQLKKLMQKLYTNTDTFDWVDLKITKPKTAKRQKRTRATKATTRPKPK